MNTLQKILIAGAIAASVTSAFAGNLTFIVNAEDSQKPAAETDSAVQKVVTEYSDLWTGTVAFKTGTPVQWYVHVPEDTEPKGCGATIKIPSLGWGTDTHNKEEGHLTLKKGDNLVYEFTPEKAGDFIFTCWMGSGCHSNYLHVTDDGNYSAEKPADPTNIQAVWDGTNAVVSFTAPEVPGNVRITGYRVIASDPDKKRKKAIGQESPITLENLDPSKTYTISIITIATSGKSAGENQVVLDAAAEPATEASTEAPTETTAAKTEAAANPQYELDNSGKSAPESTTTTVEVQSVVTDYADLWTGNITVKRGVPVKWYVNVPDDTEPKGCGATIKIPGLGWGTDTHNKEEKHFTLKKGKNLVYEFTPQETGDFLFTCWMGSGCHYNYIHVTADGVPDSNAKTGGRGTAMPTETSAAQTTAAVQTDVPTIENTTVANNSVIQISQANTSAENTISTAAVQNVSAITAYAVEHHEEAVVYAAAAASGTASNPKTGANHVALWILLAGSLGASILTKKRK